MHIQINQQVTQSIKNSNVKRQLVFKKKVQQLITGLSHWIITDSETSSICRGWFTMFYKDMNRRVENHGLEHTIKTIKFLQLCLTRYLSGDPIFTNQLRIGLRADGIPKIFNPLTKWIISRNKPVIRFILTTLSVTRLFKGNGDLCCDSIISPSTLREETIEELREFLSSKISSKIAEWFPSRGDLEWQEPHLTTKTGPNGQALGTSIKDLLSLPNDLYNTIKSFGGKGISQYLYTLKETYNLCPDWVNRNISETSFIRKISVIRDKGLKNRPIAILDYWSQSVLLPLHNGLMDMLKHFPNDCTFDQGKISEITKEWQSYYCMDLSSATDRFPIRVQEMLLAYLSNSLDYSIQWRDLMVKYPFYHKLTDKSYTYQSGQPMGAYSSWAMFTLTHHWIVHYCAYISGYIKHELYDGYAILGDDIVIRDAVVANEYSKIMKNLGVDISPMKSHSGNHLLDFSKRLWLDHEEITGVPLHGLIESSQDFFLMAQELRSCVQRSTLDNTKVPVTFSLNKFLGELYNKRSASRITLIIQDWWLVQDINNWVNQPEKVSSPQISCTRSPEYILKFFREEILQEFESIVGLMFVKLSQAVNSALDLNDKNAAEINKEHETGPFSDEMINLHGVFFSPWFIVMEKQVKLVDQIIDELKAKKRKHEEFDIEDLISNLGKIRICEPKDIISTRTSDIILKHKKKISSPLLFHVKSK
nr:MAG: RdRP [Crassitunica tubakii mitovirus 2]